MIGRGFGAVRKSGPTGGRRRRSTANSASGRIRTSRKSPCPRSRDAALARTCGQASASERRLSTNAGACAGPPRSVTGSMRVAMRGCSPRTSAAPLAPPLARARPCEARTCGACIPPGTAWSVAKTQATLCATTRGWVKTWVLDSIESSSATGAAGPGSTVEGASTSGAGGSGTTGASVAAVGVDAVDSAAGAGISSVAPGRAGSSLGDIPAVGSSS